MLDGFHVYSHHDKKRSFWNVPISDRAGSQRCALFEQHNHYRWDMDLFLQFWVQATDEQMDSTRFFSPAKILCREIKNEIINGYPFFDREGQVCTHAMLDGQTTNANMYFKVLKWLITGYIPHKWKHYYYSQWKLHHDNAHPHVVQHVRDFLISHGVEVISYTPNSSDLVPCDFFQFLQVKAHMWEPSCELNHKM